MRWGQGGRSPPPTNPTRKQHPPTRYKERRAREGQKPLAGPRPEGRRWTPGAPNAWARGRPQEGEVSAGLQAH
eukprot:4797084-Alexandrium_andersonii.AAC.1